MTHNLNVTSTYQQQITARIKERHSKGGQFKEPELQPVAASPETATPPSIPDALRPWQAVFDAMAPEHLRLLAALMAELQPLIDEAHRTVPQARGEFDSYDGIAGKGEIDRLLPSEWLWRELDEPEFLRRLLENELLYHNVHYRQPSENRAFGVLIDAGPWMLGRPRLVALAALLCLGRRAHRDRIPLYWRANNLGATAGWNKGFGRASVEYYLKEVSPYDFTKEAIEDFMAAPPNAITGKNGKPPQMRWYVIGPASHDFSESAHEATQIVIREKPGFDANGAFSVEADVALSGPQTRARQITLPYPPEETATALLRDPFTEPEKRPLPQKKPAQDASQNWALKHVAVMHGGMFVLVRKPGGVLVIDYRQRQPMSYFLPLRNYEKLVGIRADIRGLTVALMMRYLNFHRVIVTEYLAFSAGRHMFELQLGKDAPFCEGLHGEHVLPILARPGKKPVFWTIAPDRKLYNITNSGIQAHAKLKHFTIIRSLSDYVLAMRDHCDTLSLFSMKETGETFCFGSIATDIVSLKRNTILVDSYSGRLTIDNFRFKRGDSTGAWSISDDPTPEEKTLHGANTWASFAKITVRSGRFDPPFSMPEFNGDSLLSACCLIRTGGVRLIVYGTDNKGLFAQQTNLDGAFQDRRHLQFGDFRPDFAVPYKNSPHPLFVELGADGYPARLLRRLSEDVWTTTDIADEMARAKCLRD